MTNQTTRESLDIVTRYAKHIDERIAAAKLDQKLGACKHGCIPARACYSLECSPLLAAVHPNDHALVIRTHAALAGQTFATTIENLIHHGQVRVAE